VGLGEKEINPLQEREDQEKYKQIYSCYPTNFGAKGGGLDFCTKF